MPLITPTDVKNFLLIRTDPNDPQDVVTMVNNWISERINEIEATFEDICKTTWVNPKTRTDIINNARLLTWRGRLCFLVYVRYKPIVSVNEIQINISGSWRPVNLMGVEVVNDRGMIYIPFTTIDPANQWHKWKITYTYGHNELPNDVRAAMIRMVAKELVATKQLQIFIPTFPDFSEAIKQWDKLINDVISRHANLNAFT